jgi:hypothetical protein
VVLKDLVVLAAWIVGWFKTTATWRGNEFRIGNGSSLTPVATENASAETQAFMDEVTS